jgi:hypothetical protein
MHLQDQSALLRKCESGSEGREWQKAEQNVPAVYRYAMGKSDQNEEVPFLWLRRKSSFQSCVTDKVALGFRQPFEHPQLIVWTTFTTSIRQPHPSIV